MALSANQVQQFYIGYYGRPADPVGLAYWQTQDEAAALAGFASSPEFTNQLAGLSVTQQVTKVYNNLLGRAPDAEGLLYWAGELTAGRETIGSLVLAMTKNALGKDVTTIENRVEYSNAFTAALDTVDEINAYAGEAATQIARDALLKVIANSVGDRTALDAELANIDDTIATIVDGGTDNPGQTLTLTVNQDTLTGTAGNDTFDAGAHQDGAGNLINTLQNVDVLDGGAGTDTLNVTLAQATAVAATLKNIENVNVRFANAGASLDLANATGVQAVAVADSTTAGLVSNVGAIANLAVRNQNQNASFDGSTAATLNLALDTVGTAAGGNKTVDLGTATAAKATTLNVTANNAYVTVDSTNADAATTLSIAATGTNVLTFSDSANTAKAVTVTGAGSVNLLGAPFTAALTSFDASANTGGVKADIRSSVAAAVKGGSGNDVFDMDTTVTAGTTVDLGDGNDAIYVGGKLANFKSIDGGAGTDIINITDAATWTAANSKIISNFEVLDVSGGDNNGSTYDVSLGGFATVQIDEAVNGKLLGAVTLSNAANNFTLNVMSQAKTNANFALDKATAIALKDASGKNDTVNINVAINDGNNDAAADGNVTFTTSTTIAGVENINIHSAVATADKDVKASAYSTTFDDLIADSVQTLTITGDSSVTFTTLTNAGNTLTKVNASASTGNITLDAAGITSNIAYQGSAGVDTYKATDGGSIYGGAGNDQITLAAAGAGGKADTIIYKSASDVTFVDKNADGKIDAAGGIETINNFVTAGTAAIGPEEADTIDLTSFNFSGYAKSAVNKGVLAEAVESDNFQMQIADFFADAAGDRAVAYGTVTVGGTTDTYVFVDVNGDGNWDASADIAIKLAGVSDFAVTSIAF